MSDNKPYVTSVSTIPITKCRKCKCGFQAGSGDHEIELCNQCAIVVGLEAYKRLLPEVNSYTEAWVAAYHKLKETK